jgi:hypothetical protein
MTIFWAFLASLSLAIATGQVAFGFALNFSLVTIYFALQETRNK